MYFLTAPVESVIKAVVIKEIKASQLGTQLEGSVRDRLAAIDKYEDEEEVALEKVAEFFPTKYLKKNSYFTFSFFASGTAEVKTCPYYPSMIINNVSSN